MNNMEKQEAELLKCLEDTSREYAELALGERVFDYAKYKLYQIVGSSTRLEGATLTDGEVEVLLEQGRTAPGKLLEHHLMVKDNYNAMCYALDRARTGESITPSLLMAFNALNVKQTGSVVQTILGSVDMTKGEFRVSAVKSDALGYYQEASKVPALVDGLCRRLQIEMKDVVGLQEQLTCAFDAHSDLVLIHPWYDGNKRTSRLLMNYVEAYFHLPLTKVHKEDVGGYLSALKELKETGNRQPFRRFMICQHIKTLQGEMEEYRQHCTQSSYLEKELAEEQNATHAEPAKQRGFGI